MEQRARSRSPQVRAHRHRAADLVRAVESRDRLAVSKNLSAGGICFEVVGCEIALGDVLRLTFNVQDETIVAVGSVVWATDIDAFTQEVGLEFIEIDPFALEAHREQRAPTALRSLADRTCSHPRRGVMWLTGSGHDASLRRVADFHQTGAITTLHRARHPTDLERLEDELRIHAHARPIALVLPCLFDELRDTALKGIIETLRGVPYLHQVVV